MPSRADSLKRLGVASAVLLALCLVGCASRPAPESEPERPSPAALPTELPEPAPRSISLPETLPRPATVRLLDASRFSFNVLEADLRSLLLGLGRDGPFDVVVEPGVVGTVTADLRDASLLEILDELVVARGYRYAVEGRILRIFRTDRETRTYRIDYPDYARAGRSELGLAGFIGAAPSITEDDGGGGGGAVQDTSLSSLTTTQSADLWTEVERSVRVLVFGSADTTEDPNIGDAGREGPVVPRRVVASRQAGLLTVTAGIAELREVERYLEEVAVSLDRQVLIDAQFIEVTLDDDLELGIDAEGAPKLGDVTGIFARSIVPGLREAALVQGFAPVLTEGGFSFGIASDDFGVILRALATQTDVRVVSTPSIATLSNHKALIKVVRNEVFFIAEVETVITDTVVQQTTEFTPKVVPVGVTLDVTPHVSDRNEITLHVRPSVSEIVAVEPQPTSDPDLPQTGSLPVVDLRETDAVLSVPDGTTIVIGGLVRSREFEQERRIPFFGDIPWLGNLFKFIGTEERRTELLIFLRPTVLDRPRAVQIVNERERRLETLDDLRHARSLPWPWWRAPLGRSYAADGVETP
ncbi:MAG: type II secretion system protein GspD [Myxococcota bacterium]